MLSPAIRVALGVLTAAVVLLPAAPTAAPQAGGNAPQPREDYDIREHRPAVPARPADEPPGIPGSSRPDRGRRFNRESGTVRVLDRPGLRAAPGASAASLRRTLAANARLLGLDPGDLASLVPARDYVSSSTGIRHVVFRQVVDGIPVFDSAITIHLHADGTVARVTSNAAPAGAKSTTTPALTADQGRAEAALDAGVDGAAAGPPSLTWLPVDGSLRLAWHVVVPGPDGFDLFDTLIDAATAELLLRRNRVRQTEGHGRVLQGPGTAASEPRRPDAMPFGADGTLACPPPVNYAVRSLDAPFRDAATVLSPSGRLDGNNVKVFRGSSGEAAAGVFDGNSWMFDFPFNSSASAETFLFFAMNYAHDFYYDLGFDEAAGNFQVDNFGRGGEAGDPIRAKARAFGRNNANYVHAPDGNSPTINMFLWDGNGCWGEDVDGDGSLDLDGDYDLDIVLHEYHHGVSLRINSSFAGPEAGAIGEGGGDFFAYSVNGNTSLAEYARVGGLRRVNGKGYGDWYCRDNLFCGVHANGEIWANVLWDLRERLRHDRVRGSESLAVNESHQLYIDGLKLSPPRPTMLDMRDAMLEADAVRNPGGTRSENFCRVWEAFAGRGMGVSATDTADNGQNRVGPAYDVPAGCTAPPLPPLMTATASIATAYEAGSVAGAVTFRRTVPTDAPLVVRYAFAGNATFETDYLPLSGTATIPAGGSEVTVSIVPVDDTAVEGSETVTLSLTSADGYAIGSPAFATVNIVSDDVAPDLVVTQLAAPGPAGAGSTVHVSDTTRNQGTGAAAASHTSFYLSRNLLLDAADPLIGRREVGVLAPGESSSGTTALVLPSPLEAGTYYVFARADGPSAVAETNEQNNSRITTLPVGPDLMVTAFSAPAQVAPGSSFVVSDTTVNQGGGAAGASVTRFFLSANVLLDASDTPLEGRAVAGLDPAGSSTGTTTVTIPAGTVAGSYYLFAQADAGGAVAEPNEANNARLTTIRVGADLTISALTVPARAASGATILVSDTTRNSGSGSAAASVTAFYLSANLMLDAADIRLEPARAVPVLGTNEASMASTTIVLPAVAAGAWYLLAHADDGRAVPETNEANNVRFAGLQIGPDLTHISVAVPSSAAAGSSITVSDTVRNYGASTADPTMVRYYLSANAALDASDMALSAGRAVPALAPNTSNAGSTTVPLPSGVAGNYYLLVVADGDGTLAESNEANNTVARFIQISPGS